MFLLLFPNTGVAPPPIPPQPPPPQPPIAGPSIVNGLLANTINSYLFEQYADDDDLQGFVAAYNGMTQYFLDWFVSVGLPYYPGVSGPLLDWAVAGIYGFLRTSLQQSAEAVGPFNTMVFNYPQGTLNFFQQPTSSVFAISDDLFQRMLTWNFYKGDGKRFTTRWMKRRVMRFLVGVNGIDPQPSNPDFVVGTENTEAISVSVSTLGGTLSMTITINQMVLSSLVPLTPNIVQLFQLSFLSGALDLPAQYSYNVVLA